MRLATVERPFPGRGSQRVSEDRELRDGMPSPIGLVNASPV